MKLAYRLDLYIPLKYNDGRDIEPEKFQITRREFISRFGGLTWIANVGSPSIFGFWKGKHGEYQLIEWRNTHKEIVSKRRMKQSQS